MEVPRGPDWRTPNIFRGKAEKTTPPQLFVTCKEGFEDDHSLAACWLLQVTTLTLLLCIARSWEGPRLIYTCHHQIVVNGVEANLGHGSFSFLLVGSMEKMVGRLSDLSRSHSSPTRPVKEDQKGNHHPSKHESAALWKALEDGFSSTVGGCSTSMIVSGRVCHHV